MRTVPAVVTVLATMITLSAACTFTATANSSEPKNEGVDRTLRQIPQTHMFDGIALSEEQRQQMRDLMQQARHERSPISINDLEQLHELIIADKFDETSYRLQAQKIAQAEVARQVEMARIRNQMYHLLTPQQQEMLKRKHQQRIDELRRLTSMQLASPLQAASSTGSNP